MCWPINSFFSYTSNSKSLLHALHICLTENMNVHHFPQIYVYVSLPQSHDKKLDVFDEHEIKQTMRTKYRLVIFAIICWTSAHD